MSMAEGNTDASRVRPGAEVRRGLRARRERKGCPRNLGDPVVSEEAHEPVRDRSIKTGLTIAATPAIDESEQGSGCLGIAERRKTK